MISAIVLAAGLSRRMGQPKLNLPWGNTTVLGQVVLTLAEGGATDIVVVTGATAILGAELWQGAPYRLVPNPDYASQEMLSSLQVGLRALPEITQATLIALGDMPGVPVEVVRQVIAAWQDTHAKLVIPSFQMRRGHPWLVERSLWVDLLALRSPETPRHFLSQHQEMLHYVVTDSPGVLLDLDTPQDYESHKPC